MLLWFVIIYWIVSVGIGDLSFQPQNFGGYGHSGPSEGVSLTT